MTEKEDSGRAERTSFRLPRRTLADLDAIAGWLAERHGGKPNRTAALRHIAREAARKIQKNPHEQA